MKELLGIIKFLFEFLFEFLPWILLFSSRFFKKIWKRRFFIPSLLIYFFCKLIYALTSINKLREKGYSVESSLYMSIMYFFFFFLSFFWQIIEIWNPKDKKYWIIRNALDTLCFLLFLIYPLLFFIILYNIKK